MNSVKKDNNLVEFSKGTESLFVVDDENTIKFFYFGELGEFVVTKEDYVLFDATRKLYDDIMNKKDDEKDYELFKRKRLFCHFKKQDNIVKDNSVEVISQSDKKNIANVMLIERIDEDTFRYGFNIQDTKGFSVNVYYGLNDERNTNKEYSIMFKNFFDSIYTENYDYHQMNIEEYVYSLKLKK